jgi:hypothetical protein
MENGNTNEQVNNVFHAVGPNFKIFKNKMECRAKKNKIPFDEDVFMDTVIKCIKTFSKENATNIDIDNYFWKAFRQNTFSHFSRNKFRNTINLDDFEDDILDEEYNSDIDEIVDLIKKEVENEFGSQIYDAWLLHVCNNYSYSELEKCGYEGLNLHNEFRQIKRHISSKYLKENKKLRTLLAENNFI